MPFELTQALLSNAAGWETMKQARLYLDRDQVLSSDWSPPLLKGIVQAGETSFRAGLVIKGPIDIENICTCRDAREWGKICAHSVAVGLHWIRQNTPAGAPPSAATGGARPRSAGSSPAPAPLRQTPSFRRGPSGTGAELCLILPPNFAEAAGRGRIMVVLEASWSGGRCPLNALPKDRLWTFSEQDNAVLDRFEELAPGETPALLQLAA